MNGQIFVDADVVRTLAESQRGLVVLEALRGRTQTIQPVYDALSDMGRTRIGLSSGTSNWGAQRIILAPLIEADVPIDPELSDSVDPIKGQLASMAKHHDGMVLTDDASAEKLRALGYPAITLEDVFRIALEDANEEFAPLLRSAHRKLFGAPTQKRVTGKRADRTKATPTTPVVDAPVVDEVAAPAVSNSEPTPVPDLARLLDADTVNAYAITEVPPFLLTDEYLTRRWPAATEENIEALAAQRDTMLDRMRKSNSVRTVVSETALRQLLQSSGDIGDSAIEGQLKLFADMVACKSLRILPADKTPSMADADDFIIAVTGGWTHALNLDGSPHKLDRFYMALSEIFDSTWREANRLESTTIVKGIQSANLEVEQ